ncbi:MAG: hypothetical protein CMJ75_11240 [Planctomycetaceae bacterium]|nr:hypothetical protein [Planctomycetaceae bacterium]
MTLTLHPSCLALATVIVMLAGALMSPPVHGQAANHAQAAATLWTTGDSLLPAWGFFPLRQAYGGTKPLGGRAAWCAAGNQGQLTWVADVPVTGTYQVWVRHYGGYGNVQVLLDEQLVTGGRGGPSGGRYVWRHAGQIEISAGTHHVDLLVSRGMFDAVLLTTDRMLNPSQQTLPPPLKKPVLRALRTYRDDAHLEPAAGKYGFVLGCHDLYAEALYDWLPDKVKPPRVDRLSLWGAAGQYINGTLAVRALTHLDALRVSLPQLVGPNNNTIGSSAIDVRVVHVRPRKNTLFESGHSQVLVPELLLRDDRTGWPPKGDQGGYGGGQCVTRIPAHQSRQLWLTVHIPTNAPAGSYRGTLALTAASVRQLPVVLEVLPVALQPAKGYYGIYHRSQPVDPDKPFYVSPKRYLAELEDQVRHGLNAATLYGGFSTLKLARQAGLSRAPCLMHWPDGNAAQQVQAAKQMGFDDLYYYGVDEPTQPAQIERCRQEAERRQRAGLHMFTAINSQAAQAATRDFIDRPVYNIYVFGGKQNSEVTYVRQRGFRPISYWVSATAYPLPYRALTGLYNKACGYQGSSPWAYQDYPDQRLYDPDQPAHKVTYPDESGLPIPTLAWEAHRAGIDDVRYLEALDRVLAAAQQIEPGKRPPALATALAVAQQTRKQHFESIDGRWFEYLCRIAPGDLQQSRRALAEATVQLQQALPR